MTQLLTGVKSYAVFYLVVILLIQLVPKENYRNYIQFFLGILLVYAFLSPVVSLLFDSDAFFASVEQEAVLEQLEELEKDTDRIEFLQEDYYEKQSTKVLELELEQMALAYQFEVVGTEISYDADGKIDSITMTVGEKEEGIHIEEVKIGAQEVEEREEGGELKKSICDYFGMEEDAVFIFVKERS